MLDGILNKTINYISWFCSEGTNLNDWVNLGSEFLLFKQMLTAKQIISFIKLHRQLQLFLTSSETVCFLRGPYYKNTFVPSLHPFYTPLLKRGWTSTILAIGSSQLPTEKNIIVFPRHCLVVNKQRLSAVVSIPKPFAVSEEVASTWGINLFPD